MPALKNGCYLKSYSTDEVSDGQYCEHPFNSDSYRNKDSIPVNNRLRCKLCPRYFSNFKYFALHIQQNLVIVPRIFLSFPLVMKLCQKMIV